MNIRASICACTLLLPCGALHAQINQQQTLPQGYASIEGNSSTAGPLDTVDSQKWHWIYDSTQFLAQGPILITAIELRADRAAPPWSAATFPQVEVLLGPVRNDHAFGSYDPQFAANWRVTAPAPLFSGALAIAAGAGGAAPNPWGAMLSGSPVYYDPRQGDDLTIQIRTPAPAGTSGNPRVFALDAAAAAAGQNGGNRSGHTSDPHAATANRLDNELVPIVRITYRPAVGLFADFAVSAARGPIPLSVQFSDRSYASSGQITAWAWDFEGDGIVDSTLQNPTHTYRVAGFWRPRLTVRVAGGPMATKGGTLMSEDNPPPIPKFTPIPDTAPILTPVTLVDLSLYGPDEYHWTVGAGATETCQPGNAAPPASCGATPTTGVPGASCSNPTRTFSSAGNIPIQQGVRRGGTPPCPPPLSTFTAYVCIYPIDPDDENERSAALFHLPFNERQGAATCNAARGRGTPERPAMNRSGWQGDPGRQRFMGNEPGAGCLAANPSNPAWVDTGWPYDECGSVTFAWWQRERFMPGALEASAWGAGPGAAMRCFTGGLAGSGLGFSGTALGTYLSTLSVQGSPGVWKHCALVIDNFAGEARWYVDGVPDPVALRFPPGTYVRETQGTSFQVGRHDSASSALTAFFDLDDFRLHGRALTRTELLAAMAGETATTCRFGDACPSPVGTPRIGARGAPQLGSSAFEITLKSGDPNAAGLLVAGFTVAAAGPIPLPFDLGLLDPRWQGCALRVAPELIFPLGISAQGEASLPSPIPADPLVAGFHVYAQILTLGSAAGSATQGLDIAIQR